MRVSTVDWTVMIVRLSAYFGLAHFRRSRLLLMTTRRTEPKREEEKTNESTTPCFNYTPSPGIRICNIKNTGKERIYLLGNENVLPCLLTRYP